MLSKRSTVLGDPSELLYSTTATELPTHAVSVHTLCSFVTDTLAEVDSIQSQFSPQSVELFSSSSGNGDLS